MTGVKRKLKFWILFIFLLIVTRPKWILWQVGEGESYNLWQAQGFQLKLITHQPTFTFQPSFNPVRFLALYESVSMFHLVELVRWKNIYSTQLSLCTLAGILNWDHPAKSVT